jgi:type I restriction enzyme M protein
MVAPSALVRKVYRSNSKRPNGNALGVHTKTMLTDSKLRSQVDMLWDKLWTGGLSNPLDAIEQLSYLLFLKRLDDEENHQEKLARMRGQSYEPGIPETMRWRHWINLEGSAALKHLRDQVFPWFRALGTNSDADPDKKDDAAPQAENSFELYMKKAELKINKASLLIEACKLIDQMQVSSQNQDVQGDLYEYLLSKLSTAGRNGQFRTPRHIIRMMVQMIDPKPNERVGDMAAGTGGFLVNAYQYILEKKTAPENLTYDADGWPHHLTGELLTDDERTFLQDEAFHGYDNDSGMTMLRIGSMNLILHGIDHPHFYYMDTLSKEFNETKSYDVILMNPPFKGAVDANDVNPTLSTSNTTKSELLFLHLILRVLDMGGRCAVIIPDGVLFGSNKAHINIRQKLIEENRLDGVVCMPSGVFRPYAGVSTAILFFTRGGTTDRIWFYEMEHDGFSLDDKRNPVVENDIADILACWHNRHNPVFQNEREKRLISLREQITPLKVEKLQLQAEINRLTFENAIAPEGDDQARTQLDVAQHQLADLQAQISPLQGEFNQLTRQFWVTREQAKRNKYDLSSSRYRQVEQDEIYYENPEMTMERLLALEKVMAPSIKELGGLLK